MTGVVRQGEARLKLQVRGPAGGRELIDVVVDTGSNGWLTLPSQLIHSLELPRKGTVRAQLADGSEAVLAVYMAEVIWNRRKLAIDVEQSDAAPMIGMSLLSGYEVRIEVRPGGKVSIKPLARR